MGFESEVTGIVRVNFSTRYHHLELITSIRRKEWVVVAPDNKDRRLSDLQIVLPFWVLGNIVPVLIKQFDLDPIIARAVEERLVECPGVGIDSILARRAMGVLKLC